MIQYEVVRVLYELFAYVGGGYQVCAAWFRDLTDVGQDVRGRDDDEDEELLGGREVGPRRR